MILSPDYKIYVTAENSRRSIKRYYLEEGKMLYDYREILKKMAADLKGILNSGG